MINIKLRFSSWIAARLGVEHSGWLTLDREVGEGTTVSDFLADMTMIYPGLGENVYHPDTGLADDRINVALNDHLLAADEISQKELRDGDTLILFPSSWGG